MKKYEKKTHTSEKVMKRERLNKKKRNDFGHMMIKRDVFERASKFCKARGLVRGMFYSNAIERAMNEMEKAN